jgi:hypothetical protein
MARKVDEAANYVFEQERGIYDKRHPDDARQDKIVLAWERISHETKESGSRFCFFFFYNVSALVEIVIEEGMHPIPHIIFKHPVAFMYHFTYISVLHATYYVVTLLPYYMGWLYTAIIKCLLSC